MTSKVKPAAYMKVDSPIKGHTEFFKHEDWCYGSDLRSWLKLYHQKDYVSLGAELKKVKADRRACWAEFKVMTRSCLAAEKKLAEVEQQLLETQHELAILHDAYKLYPGAWCCRGAQFSNGWHHNENCKNWVLKF